MKLKWFIYFGERGGGEEVGRGGGVDGGEAKYSLFELTAFSRVDWQRVLTDDLKLLEDPWHEAVDWIRLVGASGPSVDSSSETFLDISIRGNFLDNSQEESEPMETQVVLDETGEDFVEEMLDDGMEQVLDDEHEIKHKELGIVVDDVSGEYRELGLDETLEIDVDFVEFRVEIDESDIFGVVAHGDVSLLLGDKQP